MSRRIGIYSIDEIARIREASHFQIPYEAAQVLCDSHESLRGIAQKYSDENRELRAQLAEKDMLLQEAKEMAEQVNTVRIMAHPEDAKEMFSNLNYLANKASDFLRKLEGVK